MVAQGFVVDLNKPLVFQVGHLGEYYQEWVHQPIVSKEGPRFFESNFWEFLTRTVWWAIPTIWLPVVCWCISWSAQMGHTASELVLMVILGIFIWTLIEYTLHRFLFHIKTKGYWANTMHYLIHGCHHKHPMDGLRLVFPPAATAVLCIPFWNLVRIFATPSTTPALFGGGLLGYVMYDVTHYYLHHGQPTSDVPKNLKVGLRMNWRSTMGRMPSDHRIRHEMYAKGGPGTCLGKCVDASQDLPCEVCMVVSRLVLGCLLDSPGSRLRKCVWVILGPISGCVPSDLKTSFRGIT